MPNLHNQFCSHHTAVQTNNRNEKDQNVNISFVPLNKLLFFQSFPAPFWKVPTARVNNHKLSGMTVCTSYIGRQQPQHAAPLTRQPHIHPMTGDTTHLHPSNKTPACAPESHWVLPSAPTRPNVTNGGAEVWPSVISLSARLFSVAYQEFFDFKIVKHNSVQSTNNNRFTMAISYKAGNTIQHLKS